MYHIVPTLVFILFLFGPSSDALGSCEVVPGFDANEKFQLFDMAACFVATKKGVVLKVKRKDNKLRFPAYHEIGKESARCAAYRGFREDTNLEILEQIAGGYTTQAVTDGTTTALAVLDGATGATIATSTIKMTGSLTGASGLSVPDDITGMKYLVINATTGGQTVTFKTAGGTGVSWATTDCH